MMLIEEALYAYLSTEAGVAALASTRGYPNVAPQEVALPNYAYQRISGPELMDHDGNAKLESGRFQFTCQGNEYRDAKNLVRAIRDALRGYYGLMGGASGVFVEGIWIIGEYDGYNEQSRVQTVRLDAEIWWRTA